MTDEVSFQPAAYYRMMGKTGPMRRALIAQWKRRVDAIELDLIDERRAAVRARLDRERKELIEFIKVNEKTQDN